MLTFFQSLTPAQWAIAAGLITPLVQYALGKIKNFSSTHNWIMSFVLPFIGTILVFLSTNVEFNHLVPVYAAIYTTGQAFYLIAVRYWVKYNELVKTLNTPTPDQTA